jgi:predicted nucleotidyltransferase
MRNASPNERKEIRQMVRRIVSQFHPEKIILFGSHARGDAGPDSDVDLLIVMSYLGSRREKQVEIRLALREIRIPKDIVVTAPEEFLWRKEVPGTIERPAAREGKILYARP